MQDESIKLLREQLYNEIWEISLSGVAKKYNVPYSALLKICKEVDIPIPTSGYWTKLEFGKPVIKTPLIESPIAEVTLTSSSTPKRSKNTVANTSSAKIKKNLVESSNVTDTSRQLLKFLTEDKRQKVLLAAQQIKMPAENAQLHKKITAYRSIVKEWNKKDTKEEFSQRSLKNYSKQPPFLAGVISNDVLQRVYRLLDALFRQVESLGGSINDDLSVQIRNERVTLEVLETQDVINHVLTKIEAQEMIKYEDEKRRFSWASKPIVRKYDYVFNGKIRICIRKGRYFKDSDKVNIESMLGNILIELYEKSEVVRIEREVREEAARKREEEERLKEERRNLYNKEVERTLALENLALDYETACRIRTYCKAVENTFKQNGLDKSTAAWIDWAYKKADWFDPILAREDELLGVREHEKSEEQKGLKSIGRHWW